MPTDNTQLNAGSGGNTLRTLADSSSVEWPVAVATYATTVSAGANVLQVVTPSAGLPVAQQGAWSVELTDGTHTVAVTTAGALQVDGSAVTQPVSGTVAIDGTVPVSGTFWQATQPVSVADPVAVTGAFWQATQPISGTVSIAGTVAVASVGGSVEITNDTGNPIPVSGTVAASQSGAWNLGTVTTVTTVSAVTAITNALPAGTNLLGKVAEAPQVASLYNGTTAVTPQYAAITAGSSGATTIVAGVTGKRIYILRWSLSANGNVNVNWQSHATTSTATGLHYLTQFASAGGAYCPAGIFATAVGEALDLNLSAAVAVGGELTYCQF